MTRLFRGIGSCVIVATIAFGCSVVGNALPTKLTTDLPSDIALLGSFRLATDQDAVGAISSQQAVEAASDKDYSWPDPTSYLTVATDLNGVRDERGPGLVWLVRWTGIDIDSGMSATKDGTTPSRPPLSYGYLFVDAKSGEFVSAAFMEAP